ncbi:ferredoxin [bacterium]|nr:ferredoxin [bacterium]
MPKVDQDKCIGCGVCVAVCEKCFKMEENGKAIALCDGSDCNCDCNLDEVISTCPVDAISK